MLIDGLVSLLLAQPAITALVGDRIQPIPAPEDLSQYPLITYQCSSLTGEYGNDGSVGVNEQRVIFDCLAVRYLAARKLGIELKNSIDGLAEDISTAIKVGPGAYYLSEGTQVFSAEVLNLVDRWEDGSRISCTTVHLRIKSNE